MRDLIPDNYETFGTQWSTLDINRYNAIQERINAFHGSTMTAWQADRCTSFQMGTTLHGLTKALTT